MNILRRDIPAEGRMIMNKKNFFAALLLILGMVALHCSNPENPYLDVNSSRALFSPLSLQDGQTVSIFGDDSIGIKIYLREHLSHLTVSTPQNRYWSDTTIESSSFSKNMLVLPLSFYGTGWQDLTLVSHRFNGDSVTQQFRVYAVSPLFMDKLLITLGDSTTLSTRPVASQDRDIRYVWNLRSDIIEYPDSSVNHLFEKLPTSSVGEVYVKDSKYRSPSFVFSIEERIVTTSGPHISIDNPVAVNDTVYTSIPDLQVAGTITGAASVSRITFNDTVVDISPGANDTLHFLYDFSGIANSAPSVVNVAIYDTLGSVTLDTFYIKYKPSVESRQPSIVMTNPAGDSVYSDNSTVLMYGQVINSEYYPSGAVTCSKNDYQIDGYRHPSGGYFGFQVVPEPGRNTVTLQFVGDTLAGTVLATKTIIIYYDPQIIDTTGPMIAVLYNEMTLYDKQAFRISDPAIDILLLDNAPIGVVLVNGMQVLPSETNTHFLPTYRTTLSLKHQYNSVTILANDNYNNPSQMVFDSLIFNQLPEISGDFTDIEEVVGDTFTWRISASDSDNDQIYVTAKVNGHALQMSSDSTVQWIPELADTGLHSVEIQAYDGYEFNTVTFDISVSKQPAVGVPVQWLTTAADIRDKLVRGEDTLAVLLQAKPLSNLQPFTYKVELTGPTGTTTVLYEGNDSNFTWLPESNQTGFSTLRFTILDRKNNVDIFTKNILITNAVPSYVEFSNDTLAGKESTPEAVFQITLSKAQKAPVTVKYALDTSTTADSTDFTLPPEDSLTFAPGELEKSVTVKIIDDSTAEKEEKLVLRITDVSSNARLGVKKSATYSILDNDYSNFSFESSVEIFGRPDYYIDTAHIVVTLSRPQPKPVTVSCAIVDEHTNATSADFTFPLSSRTITFAADAVKDTIVMIIQPNRRYGPLGSLMPGEKKCISMKLSSTEECLQEGDITFHKSIIGDPTTFTIDDNRLAVPREGDSAIFHIRRNDTIYTNVSFYFEVNTALTTAEEGVDFRITTSNPLTFDQYYLRSKLIKVAALNNNMFNNNKRVVIDIIKVTIGGVLESGSRLEVVPQSAIGHW